MYLAKTTFRISCQLTFLTTKTQEEKGTTKKDLANYGM